MNAARRSAIVALGLAAVVGVAMVGLPSEERDIERVVARAVTAVQRGTADEATYRARLAHDLAPLLAEDFSARIGVAPTLVGRDAIVGAVLEASRQRPRAVVTTRNLVVTVEGRQARATGSVAVSESQSGDLHADERRFEAALVEANGAWRLSGVTVAARSNAEPEARP